MNILNFLRNSGMSQSDLAKKLGVTSQNVNRWVNNKGTPSYEICKKLLELGMLVDDLFDIDYKSMHDHDTYSSAIAQEKKKQNDGKNFYDLFKEAMQKWNDDNKNDKDDEGEEENKKGDDEKQ